VDFAGIARGCGVEGERVTNLSQLADALRRTVGTGRPYLVDVVIDPTVNAWTFPAFQPFDPQD